MRYMENEVTPASQELRALRLRAGLSMNALAKLLGYKGSSSIQRYEDPSQFVTKGLPAGLVVDLMGVLVGKGDPPITDEEVSSLADLPGRKRKNIAAKILRKIPVHGVVAAGVWLESDVTPETFGSVPVVPNDNFPPSAQFGLRVRGTSLNKIAIEGDTLICVSTDQTGITPREGDLVVAQRSRHQGELLETTAKRIRKNGAFELWPESSDPDHQTPLIIPDDPTEGAEEIRIIAIVTGIYRDITKI